MIKCAKCKGDKVVMISSDVFACDECENTIVLDAMLCTECDLLFRTVNGKMHDSIVVPKTDVFNEILSNSSFLLDDDSMAMSDMIHNCLECGKLAYEYKENCFRCCDNACGFEWEIT